MKTKVPFVLWTLVAEPNPGTGSGWTHGHFGDWFFSVAQPFGAHEDFNEGRQLNFTIKSIVKIRFVAKEPIATWSFANPKEYGFYSNVNPEVDHPRWSQATERRIGEFSRRPTLMFNGYIKEVADMYKGMDLQKYY